MTLCPKGQKETPGSFVFQPQVVFSRQKRTTFRRGAGRTSAAQSLACGARGSRRFFFFFLSSSLFCVCSSIW